MRLVDKHFPRHHKYYKLFNRKNIKLSYRCMPSTDIVIRKHDFKIMKDPAPPTIRTKTCTIYDILLINIYLSICLSIYIFICLSINLFYLSPSLSLRHFKKDMQSRYYIYLSIYLSISIYIYIYIYIYMYIYIYI